MTIDCTAICPKITMTQTCAFGASWFPMTPMTIRSAADKAITRLGCEFTRFSTLTC